MKKFYTLILVAILALPTFAQITEANCPEKRVEYGYPSYYCDCQFNFVRLRELPNTVVTDTIWYKTNAGLFLSGCSAYLFGENPVDMTIMMGCHNKEGDATFRRYTVNGYESLNINADDIKSKLEGAGASVGNNTVIYVCIAPSKPGTESRFICKPYNQGPNSTCDDCLPLIRGMELVSSDMENVYVLTPDEIPAVNGLQVEWYETDYPVMLTIKKGDCQYGAVVASTMLMPDEAYELPASLLSEMRGGNENLYLQFSSVGASARIRLSEVQKTPTGCENITTPATDARLVIGNNGMIYIMRDGVRYTLTGARF